MATEENRLKWALEAERACWDRLAQLEPLVKSWLVRSKLAQQSADYAAANATELLELEAEIGHLTTKARKAYRRSEELRHPAIHGLLPPMAMQWPPSEALVQAELSPEPTTYHGKDPFPTPTAERRSCPPPCGKRRYPSERQVLQANRRNGHAIRPYYDQRCRCWHAAKAEYSGSSTEERW